MCIRDRYTFVENLLKSVEKRINRENICNSSRQKQHLISELIKSWGQVICLSLIHICESQDAEKDVDSDTIRRVKIIFTPGYKFKEMLSKVSVQKAVASDDAVSYTHLIVTHSFPADLPYGAMVYSFTPAGMINVSA